MKRIISTLIMSIVFCSVAIAQNNENCKTNSCCEKKIEERTTRMANRYGLDAEQRSKLMKLNEQYAGTMNTKCVSQKSKTCGEQAPKHQCRNNAESKEQKKDLAETDRKEMTTCSMAYLQEIQKIFSKEQFKQFQSDRKVSKGRRGGCCKPKSCCNEHLKSNK